MTENLFTFGSGVIDITLIYQIPNRKTLIPDSVRTTDIDKNVSTNKIPSLGWLEGLSKLLDSQFTFPGTKFRFGLDPIIGLIPLLGNASTFLVSAALYVIMAKKGASRKVSIMMAFNILLDFILTSIPLIGWIFDSSFKANNRNIKLLKEHYLEGKHQGSGTGVLLLIFLFLFILCGLVIYLSYKMISYIIHLVNVSHISI